MNSDQESNTNDSSFDDRNDFYDGNESDIEIDEVDDCVENEAEEEPEWN